MVNEEQIEHLIRENNRLLKENNMILRKMRRASIISFWAKTFLYVLIIGGPIIFFKYYLEEYWIEAKNVYTELNGTLEEVSSVSENLPF